MLIYILCSVIQCTRPVFYIQISMNVTQTMEAVHSSVPTHQDLEGVAAGVDTGCRVMAECVKVSFNCTTLAGDTTTCKG